MAPVHWCKNAVARCLDQDSAFARSGLALGTGTSYSLNAIERGSFAVSNLPFIYIRPGHKRHNAPCDVYFSTAVKGLCYVQFADGTGLGAIEKQVMENPNFGNSEAVETPDTDRVDGRQLLRDDIKLTFR